VRVLDSARSERRFGDRIRFETNVTAYLNNATPARGFTTDISEAGLHLQTLPSRSLPPFSPVGLELSLPGVGETLWLAGEMRFEEDHDGFFHSRGIRFRAMANLHARLLSQFCEAKRICRA